MLKLSDGRWLCNLCDRSFCSARNARDHFKNLHTPRTRFRCLVCENGAVYKHRKSFRNHLSKIHKIFGDRIWETYGITVVGGQEGEESQQM